MTFKFPTHKTPILCQGITSEKGVVHTELARAYGSLIVAGTSRDKNVTSYQGIPVFKTVKEAVRKTKPVMSVIFATPARALSDVEEAARAKIPVIICTAEHVPLHDTLKMIALADKYKVTVLGPSSPGIVRVGECLAGSIPAHLFPKGNIGIIGRSSSLIYEAVQQLAEENLGVSTCVALGASPLVSTSFEPVLRAMLADKQTKAVLVIGQVIGNLEADLAAAYKKSRSKKPLVVYIPGKTLPTPKRLTLLGTKLEKPVERITTKKTALVAAGAVWVANAADMGKIMARTIVANGKKQDKA